MTLAEPLSAFVTPKRLRYAWVTAAVVWGVWLCSIVSGQGISDRFGQIVGTDYIQFYAAGELVRSGDNARLYDLSYQREVEERLAGRELSGVHAFLTPPFLALVFVPLSLVPYLVSFLLWSVVGIALLALSCYLLSTARPVRSCLWGMTFFPVFAAVSFGQNSLLSVAIVSGVYWLWRSERRTLAGLLLSLLLYKPQLLLGLVLLWLVNLRRDWRCLAGLCVGTLGIVLGTVHFMPDAAQGYVTFALHSLRRVTEGQGFPLWHAYSLRAFWELLLPSSSLLAITLSAASMVCATGLLFSVAVWRRVEREPQRAFAAAIAVTVIASPHVMIYDWALLVVPAVLLWDGATEERRLRYLPLFSLVWLVSLVSSALTQAELSLLPFALQVGVPVLVLVAWEIFCERDDRELPSRPRA